MQQCTFFYVFNLEHLNKPSLQDGIQMSSIHENIYFSAGRKCNKQQTKTSISVVFICGKHIMQFIFIRAR